MLDYYIMKGGMNARTRRWKEAHPDLPAVAQGKNGKLQFVEKWDGVYKQRSLFQIEVTGENFPYSKNNISMHAGAKEKFFEALDTGVRQIYSLID